MGIAAGSIHGFLVTVTVDDTPPESIIVSVFWDGKAWRHNYFNYSEDGFYGTLYQHPDEDVLGWVDQLLEEIAQNECDNFGGDVKKITVKLDASVHTKNWEHGDFVREKVFNFSEDEMIDKKA